MENYKIEKLHQEIARRSIHEFSLIRVKKGMNAAVSVASDIDSYSLVAFSGLDSEGYVAVFEHKNFEIETLKLIDWKYLEKNNNIAGPLVGNLDCNLDMQIENETNEHRVRFEDEKLFREIEAFPKSVVGLFQKIRDLPKKVSKYAKNMRAKNFMDKMKQLAQTVESIETETESEMMCKSNLVNQIKSWISKFAPQYHRNNCAEPHVITLSGRVADVFKSKPNVGSLMYLSTYKITKSMDIKALERCQYCKITTSQEFQSKLKILTDP